MRLRWLRPTLPSSAQLSRSNTPNAKCSSRVQPSRQCRIQACASSRSYPAWHQGSQRPTVSSDSWTASCNAGASAGRHGRRSTVPSATSRSDGRDTTAPFVCVRWPRDNKRLCRAGSPLTARILDGKRIAQLLLERVGRRVSERKAQGLAEPGLAVVLVGDDAASSVYVRNKRKARHQVGFRSFDYDLPSNTTQAELFALIDKLTADPAVHGILVQSPLPPHIDEDALVERIDAGKDVDGFQAVNVGRLALRRFGLRPCTP